MAQQHLFRLDKTTIDLSRVIDVAQPLVPEDAPDEDAWLMVRLENDVFTTVKGRSHSRAFIQALEAYVRSNLN